MNKTRSTRRPAASGIRTAGWLSVAALLATATFAPATVSAAKPADPTPVTVAASSPAYGSGIVVDGNRAEWTAADRLADMYRAGRADKELEATLFARYDCVTSTLAVMVQTAPGVTLDLTGDQFVKVDGAKRIGSPSVGNFTFSPDGLGWEGSFSLAAGTYDLDVHAQVLHGGSQTAALDGRSLTLLIACAVPTPTPEVTPTPTGSVAASPTGGVLGAVGAPALTLPPTDATIPTESQVTDQGWRLALLLIAGLIGASLLAGPRRATRSA